MVEHARDEILDRAIALPQERQTETLGKKRVRGTGEARADIDIIVAQTPVAVAQTFADDMGRVHVRADPEGPAQGRHKGCGIACRDHRHAIDRGVVDPGGKAGVGQGDIEAEDIALRQGGDDLLRVLHRGWWIRLAIGHEDDDPPLVCRPGKERGGLGKCRVKMGAAARGIVRQRGDPGGKCVVVGSGRIAPQDAVCHDIRPCQDLDIVGGIGIIIGGKLYNQGGDGGLCRHGARPLHRAGGIEGDVDRSIGNGGFGHNLRGLRVPLRGAALGHQHPGEAHRPWFEIGVVAKIDLPQHQAQDTAVARHRAALLRCQIVILPLAGAAHQHVDIPDDAALAALAAEQLRHIDADAPTTSPGVGDAGLRLEDLHALCRETQGLGQNRPGGDPAVLVIKHAAQGHDGRPPAGAQHQPVALPDPHPH